MLNIMEVHETNKMIEQEKLDVRTITMGISLLDCATDDLDRTCENIYRKITAYAKDLVPVGEAIATTASPSSTSASPSPPSRSSAPAAAHPARTSYASPTRSTAPPRRWAST